MHIISGFPQYSRSRFDMIYQYRLPYNTDPIIVGSLILGVCCAHDLTSGTIKIECKPHFLFPNWPQIRKWQRLQHLWLCDLMNVATGGVQSFSRQHPLACWFGSMMLCFAGGILGNFLLGEPLLSPFQSEKEVLTATVVWWEMLSICHDSVDHVYTVIHNYGNPYKKWNIFCCWAICVAKSWHG